MDDNAQGSFEHIAFFSGHLGSILSENAVISLASAAGPQDKNRQCPSILFKRLGRCRRFRQRNPCLRTLFKSEAIQAPR